MTDVVGTDSLAERLLDAAETEILVIGTTEVSLRAIARRVGVSHQAPGYAFNDRRGLLAALATRGHHVMHTAITTARDALPRGSSARHVLVETGVAYILTSAARPALFRLMTRSDFDEGHGELVTARMQSIAVLHAAVRDAMHEGWHAGESLDDVAALCWATVHGFAVLHADGALRFIVDQPLERSARTVMGQLLDVTPHAPAGADHS